MGWYREGVSKAVRFNRPVFLTGASDGSGRLFVVEQDGVIRKFDNNEDEEKVEASTTFLDIRDRIIRQGNEEGLLGLAFHPEFEINGEFYVHYSSKVNDTYSIVARYRVSSDNPDIADPDSEEIILQQQQPYRNHNGGTIAFGPDGYLYLSLGDGGSANDPHGNGQDLTNWLGAILRIDVDRKQDGLEYAIPNDNPFVDRQGAKPELWAVGLRNVWRMSFDRATGEWYGRGRWARSKGGNRFDSAWRQLRLEPIRSGSTLPSRDCPCYGESHRPDRFLPAE